MSTRSLEQISYLMMKRIIPIAIMNKIKMLTTISHWPGSPRLLSDKEKKGHKNLKGRNKTVSTCRQHNFVSRKSKRIWSKLSGFTEFT